MIEIMGDNILIRGLTNIWLIRKDKHTKFYNLYYWSKLVNGWYSAGVGDYDWKVVYRKFMGFPPVISHL